MQGEHKLKFWLKNIHKYQNGSMSFFSFIFWLTKLGLFILKKKDMLPFWNSWIFLSQNYILCSFYRFWLALKRTKQFFDDFVSKIPLKKVSFVWKIGLGRFVFSTTVYPPEGCPIFSFLSLSRSLIPLPTKEEKVSYTLVHLVYLRIPVYRTLTVEILLKMLWLRLVYPCIPGTPTVYPVYFVYLPERCPIFSFLSKSESHSSLY